MKGPIISVYMTTYFHERYVKQAIESVLRQKITVPYEIVISDDCSNDNTIKIINKYKNTHSNIVVNVNKKNIGLTENIFLAKSMCRGKYVVGIAGDDYWIDEYKLQKQYDFLTTNLRYIGVATQMEIRVDDSQNAFRITPVNKETDCDFTLKDFLKGKDFPLNGLMHRNLCLTDGDKKYFSLMPQISKYIDDLTDCILLLKKGDIFILKGATNVYRVRSKKKDQHNFNQSNKGNIWFERHIDMLNKLYTLYGNEMDLSTRYAMVCAVGLTHAIYYHQMKQFFNVYSSIPYSKIYIGMKSIKHVSKKILQVLSDKVNKR